MSASTPDRRGLRRQRAGRPPTFLLVLLSLLGACSPGEDAGPEGAPLPADGRALRVVSLDYGLTETLLAMGVEPVGVPDLSGYDRWVVEPELPPDVVDVGSTFDPNLELIQQLEPDLILTTPFLAGVRHRLERIAPTVSMAIYSPEGGGAYESAVAVTRRLGERLGREREAEELIRRVEATLDSVRRRLRGRRTLPLYVVRFMDPRHVRVFGENSMYDDVLERLDVPNAWGGETNYWGFSTVGIEALATERPVRLFYLRDPPRGVLTALDESPLWSRLPFVEAGRVAPFPMVLEYGGLPSAGRFAALLAERLPGGER